MMDPTTSQTFAYNMSNAQAFATVAPILMRDARAYLKRARRALVDAHGFVHVGCEDAFNFVEACLAYVTPVRNASLRCERPTGAS